MFKISRFKLLIASILVGHLVARAVTPARGDLFGNTWLYTCVVLLIITALLFMLGAALRIRNKFFRKELSPSNLTLRRYEAGVKVLRELERIQSSPANASFSESYQRPAELASAKVKKSDYARTKEIEPAIALVRPYPPIFDLQTRSKFGGLPNLPRGVVWPRVVHPYAKQGANGPTLPLHFMAQVDLAELPWRHPLVPERGTLLYFALMDEEMTWSDEESYVRVIYDSDSNGTPTPPPSDLRAIENGYSNYDREFKLPGEGGKAIHDQSQLKAFKIESLVNGADNYDEWRDKNGDAPPTFVEFQIKQFEGQTPIAMPMKIDFDELNWVEWFIDKSQGLTEKSFAEFLYIPRAAELFVRLITIRAMKDAESIGKRQNGAGAGDATTHDQLNADLSILSQLCSAGTELIRQLGAKESQSNISNAQMQDLRAFARLANSKMSGGYRREISLPMKNVMRRYLEECNGDPGLASRISPEVFAAGQNQQAIRQNFGRDDVSVQYHQMFGHIMTSQWGTELGDDDICLLQLRSDYGVNLMICDVGEMEFWIKPADLQRLDFSKVWGTTQGG